MPHLSGQSTQYLLYAPRTQLFHPFFVYLYISIYVYLYLSKYRSICLYISIFVCLHICIFVHQYICIRPIHSISALRSCYTIHYSSFHALYICIHVYLYICIFVNIHKYISIFICLHTCIFVHQANPLNICFTLLLHDHSVHACQPLCPYKNIFPKLSARTSVKNIGGHI